MGADPVKNIAEVCKGVNPMQLTTGDETVDDGGPFGTDIASRKHPVLASNGHDTKNPLGQVVVYGKVTIVDVSIQSLPLSTGIAHCLAKGTLGKKCNRPVFQVRADLIEDGLTAS